MEYQKDRNNELIFIDGSEGEGGGQIFRSSLTLSLLTGKSVCIENIRAGRKKPGLLRQHLTCLRGAKEISNASVIGDEIGSNKVVFKPGRVRAGKYQFSVGSAGSTTLVFQTVFLPLLFAEDESELILEGGTHNGMAPSVDFISKSFLPLMRKMGAECEVCFDKYGFYPAGGGWWKIKIKPASKLAYLEMKNQVEYFNKSATAIESKLPRHITARELSVIQNSLNWPSESLFAQSVSSVGPGNIISIALESSDSNLVVEVVGEKRLSAEKVATKAVEESLRYLEAKVPVCEYLADQLLLPLAIGDGGSFLTVKPSLHFTTNAEVISKFLDVKVIYEKLSNKTWMVNVSYVP